MRLSQLLMLTIVLVTASTALADGSKRAAKELQAIRAVIEQNFQASNEEDVDAVLDTMTPYTPNREQFAEELAQFFEATDVYMRLVDLTLVSFEMERGGARATIRVVQQTLSRSDEAIPYSEFQTRSAMLPPWEVCEYEVELHKLHGAWKAHMIGGDVREAQLPEKQDVKERPNFVN